MLKIPYLYPVELKFINFFNIKVIENLYDLNNLLKIDVENIEGIVIIISNNFKFISELKKLRRLFTKFYIHKKYFGLWNTSYCFKQFVIGRNLYSKSFNLMVKENNLFYIKYNFLLYYKFNRLKCKNCFNVNKCNGIFLDTSKFITYRRFSSYNKYLVAKNFGFFNNKFMKKTYNRILEHIKYNDVKYANRIIQLVYNFKLYNENENYFSERFVYYCRYVNLYVLKKEMNFLDNLTKVEFKNFIKLLLKNDLLEGYAYSLGVNKKNFRETFYIFSNKSMIISILKKYFLNLTFNNFENLYFIGFDFKNKNLFGIKVYSKISNYLEFINYIKNCYNLDLFKILDFSNIKSLIYVRRFKNNKMIGFKIDFKVKDKVLLLLNLSNFKIKNSDFIRFFDKKFSRIAFDFDLEGNLLKINLYYDLA